MRTEKEVIEAHKINEEIYKGKKTDKGIIEEVQYLTFVGASGGVYHALPQIGGKGLIVGKIGDKCYPIGELIFEKISELEKLVSNDELDNAWGNANFGGTPKREVLKDTLLKLSGGYSTGNTACCICEELKLIKRSKQHIGSRAQYFLTKKGKYYLYEAFKDYVKDLNAEKAKKYDKLFNTLFEHKEGPTTMMGCYINSDDGELCLGEL